MMGLLDIFKAALPARKPAAEPRSAMWLPGTNTPLVAYAESIAAEAGLAHPVVFRCLQKIGEAVQGVNWYCEPDETLPASRRPSATQVDEINQLLKSPHDSLTADQWRFWAAMVFAVYAKIPFVVGSLDGKANALYPLQADQVRIKRNNRGSITAYSYGPVGSDVDYPVRRDANGKSYAFEISRPGLTGTTDDKGRPRPLGAIGMPAQIISLLLQRAVDTASGHPNTKYLLSTDKPVTHAQRTELASLLQEMKAGEVESGNALLLEGVDIKVAELDNDLGDIHSKVPLDDMARMIAGSLGVPIPLLGLGASDAAKFTGNYSEARRSFWEETIIPGYLTPLSSGLTAAICPPGAVIRFDLDTIEALQDSRVIRGEKVAKIDFLTDDEKRDLMGYPKLTPEQKTEISERRAAGKPTPAPAADTAPTEPNPPSN